MATLIKHSGYPDLLVGSGTDLVTPGGTSNQAADGFRTVLKNLLFSDNNGVRNFKGGVDFVVAYIDDGGKPNFSGADHSTVSWGRPFRGIAQLPGSNDLGADVPTTLGKRLNGVAHEVGHYWLATGSATIQTSSGWESLPTSDGVRLSLLEGQGLPRFPIMGREHNHWSPYLSLDNSREEAGFHSFADPGFEWAVGHTFSEGVDRPTRSFNLAGFGPVDVGFYGQLERYIMGFIDDSTASQLSFNVLRPRWIFPMDFQTGLFVELNDGDRWYLGFHKGPNKLSAVKAGNPPEQVITLSDPFNPHDRVAFRVVQNDDQVRLQARVWEGPRFPNLEGCLAAIARMFGVKFVRGPYRALPLTCQEVLGDMEVGAAQDSQAIRKGWFTVAEVDGQVARAGLSTRHLSDGGGPFVRTSASFCLWDGNQISSYESAQLEFDPGLTDPDPNLNCRVLDDGSLSVPWNVARQDEGMPNNSPKLTLQVPNTDFAFGGQFNIEECCLITWAGGGYRNKTYVGAREKIKFHDFNFNAHTADWQILRERPSGDEYRFIFCLLTPGPLTVEHDEILERLDLIRRGWDVGFETIAPTSGTPRRANTRWSQWG